MDISNITTSGQLNAKLRELKGKDLQMATQKPGTYLYFAYGSNMSISQMAIRCPLAKPMFKATLHGAKMVFKTYADVIRTKLDAKAFTRGAIFEITDSCMEALDRYEGFPTMYKKVKCIVQGPYDEYYEAFMYVMQKGVRELKLPSQQYLDIIYQGYLDWKIPTTSLCKAWEYTALKLGEIEQLKGHRN